MSTDNDKINAAIAALLRLAREEAGLSQGGLSRILGWHRSRISKLEAATQPMAACDLGAYARALGCPVAALLPARWTR